MKARSQMYVPTQKKFYQNIYKCTHVRESRLMKWNWFPSEQVAATAAASVLVFEQVTYYCVRIEAHMQTRDTFAPDEGK